MQHRGREKSRRLSSRMSRYGNLKEIGGGTFGTVYEGVYRGHRYAIKKYTYSDEPLHHTTVRELKALMSFKSPYILSVEEIVVENYQIYAVFPHYSDDLTQLLSREALTLSDCRDIFRQVLCGVREIHSSGMVHRDLKPANILVRRTHKSDEEQGSAYAACVCDFGMTKKCGVQMTPNVVTLWYRAPELLLGFSGYGPAADIWSLGCILYEMLKGTPLFKGSSEPEELSLITELCGSINSESMPECESYPLFQKYRLSEGDRKIKKMVAPVSPEAADLLDRMMVLNPKDRCTVDECLAHPFFTK